MKINAIIQARTGSTRLPNKVMREIAGVPIIGYLMERVKKSGVDETIVAIPEQDCDGPLGRYVVLRAGLAWGPEENVAERFRCALKSYPCDAFVRICADSPLIDPQLIDDVIRLFRLSRPAVATNCFPYTYPAGQCVEVVDTVRFLAAVDKMDDYEHEHVVPYFYRHHPEDVRNLSHHRDLSKERMLIDTEEDFARVAAIIEKMDKPHWQYGWQELLLL